MRDPAAKARGRTPFECRSCGASYTGDRVVHCIRCHETFAGPELFFDHFAGRSIIDDEGDRVFVVTGCLDPHSAADDLVLVRNQLGTPVWTPTPTE